jgi:mannose/fructose/N-acetylgalactosamine-specific phosphotransferase system component IID
MHIKRGSCVLRSTSWCLYLAHPIGVLGRIWVGAIFFFIFAFLLFSLSFSFFLGGYERGVSPGVCHRDSESLHALVGTSRIITYPTF